MPQSLADLVSDHLHTEGHCEYLQIPVSAKSSFGYRN